MIIHDWSGTIIDSSKPSSEPWSFFLLSVRRHCLRSAYGAPSQAPIPPAPKQSWSGRMLSDSTIILPYNHPVSCSALRVTMKSWQHPHTRLSFWGFLATCILLRQLPTVQAQENNALGVTTSPSNDTQSLTASSRYRYLLNSTVLQFPSAIQLALLAGPSLTQSQFQVRAASEPLYGGSSSPLTSDGAHSNPP